MSIERRLLIYQSDKFFVIGLQRSGTSFFRDVIERNSNLKFEKIGWKHTMEELPACNIVAITKSPYNWTDSICHRNRVDLVESFPDYKLNISSEHCHRTIDLQSLMRLWADWNIHWYNKKIMFFKYEDLLKEPIYQMKRLRDRFDCDVTLPPVMNYDPEKRKKYLSFPNPAHPFTKKLNRYIDFNVASILGYPNG